MVERLITYDWYNFESLNIAFWSGIQRNFELFWGWFSGDISKRVESKQVNTANKGSFSCGWSFCSCTIGTGALTCRSTKWNSEFEQRSRLSLSTWVLKLVKLLVNRHCSCTEGMGNLRDSVAYTGSSSNVLDTQMYKKIRTLSCFFIRGFETSDKEYWLLKHNPRFVAGQLKRHRSNSSHANSSHSRIVSSFAIMHDSS